MKEQNKRKLFLKIRVSEEEMATIKKKQQNSGIPTVSDFVRTMIFRGVILHVDRSILKTTNVLLSNVSNNVNQLAYRTNQSGNVYKEDIDLIKDEIHQILHILLKVQASVMKVKPSENLKSEINEINS